MSRQIAELPLPHFLKKALKDKEYEAVADLAGVSAVDLALELSIGVAQAEDILRQADEFGAGPSRLPPTLPRGSQLHSSTASALLHSANRTRFSTLCSGLDSLIVHFAPARACDLEPPGLQLKGKPRTIVPATGPIAPGMVLEVSGPPGGGKTCVAIGAALSARLGDGNEDDCPEVLIVDTEASITSERVRAALETLVEGGGADRPSLDPLLDGIHLIRVPTQAEMVALLYTLDDWLEAHPKVKLVIIDTLSFHFRQPTLDLGARKRVMEVAKKVIGQAATVHGCAVIIMTQLATKLLTSENKPANFETSDRAVLMPQLGDAWTTERTVRVTLFRGAGDDLRYAHASTTASSSSNPGADDLPWASFDIDHVGLPCDIPPLPVAADFEEAGA